MMLMRVRSRMRRIRAEIEEAEESNGELNLVPYLDIATNVVMFLLATVTFSAPLAQITINTPKIGGGSGGPESKEALRLAVAVSPKGFIVTGEDPILEPQAGGKRFPMDAAGEYDWAGLANLLARVKAAHPKEESILVALDPYLPYDLLVRTFDVVRMQEGKDLFPNATLGVEE
jgi:biopolymer transport protein ExbD